MRKIKLATLIVGSALAVLLPVTNANAATANAGTHLAVVASGSVVNVANPDPTQPFAITNNTGGNFTNLVMAGLFTAGTGGACPTTVAVTTPGGIPFSVPAQNFLLGYGSIGSGAFTGTNGVCAVNGALTNGAFVRVGTVAVAMFQVNEAITGPLAGTGSTIGTFVGAAVPGGPPCTPPVTSLAICSGIAGPVVG